MSICTYQLVIPAHLIMYIHHFYYISINCKEPCIPVPHHCIHYSYMFFPLHHLPPPARRPCSQAVSLPGQTQTHTQDMSGSDSTNLLCTSLRSAIKPRKIPPVSSLLPTTTRQCLIRVMAIQ